MTFSKVSFRQIAFQVGTSHLIGFAKYIPEHLLSSNLFYDSFLKLRVNFVKTYSLILLTARNPLDKNLLDVSNKKKNTYKEMRILL